MIMFGCGDKDASALRYQLGSYEPLDLVNLGKFEALCPPESAQNTFPFRTKPPAEKLQRYASDIIEYTRKHYATEHVPGAQEEAKLQAAPHAVQDGIRPVAESTQAAQPKPTPPSVVLVPVYTDAPVIEPLSAALSREEKILLRITQAGYLSTQQLIELCFADLATLNSKKKSASIALKRLEEQKRLSSMLFEREKVWYVGKKPNVRRHDIIVRDIFTRIVKTDWEILEVKFFNSLVGSNPDLSVTFASENGTPIHTFWEFDNNTEGDEVLLSKLSRYQAYLQTHKIAFVFSDEARIVKLAGKLSVPRPPVYHTTITRLALLESSFGLFSLDLKHRVTLFDGLVR